MTTQSNQGSSLTQIMNPADKASKIYELLKDFLLENGFHFTVSAPAVVYYINDIISYSLSLQTQNPAQMPMTRENLIRFRAFLQHCFATVPALKPLTLHEVTLIDIVLPSTTIRKWQIGVGMNDEEMCYPSAQSKYN